MSDFVGYGARLRGLWPVFLVAVAVVLAGTLAGSLFDKVHRVDAEGLAVAAVTARATEADAQVLDLTGWDLQLTAPLADAFPALRYTTARGDSVGLSSVDLERVSPDCTASRSGLGTLIRLGAGAFATASHANPHLHFISTIADHDYAYQSPQNACSDAAAASAIINRETSVIFEALASLSPATPR